MMLNLQYGDRHPPLHYIVLWATVKVLGDGELAVRLPSIIAGTLVIPALYLLGRELYDRRTGLVAAAFGTVSPLLIWYSQEARMYAFVTLFGLLALLTQLRAIRNPSMLNWALYILATAALLWSHYFGLLLVGVQQVIWLGVLLQKRRAQEPFRPLALGFALLARGARDAADTAHHVRPQAVHLDGRRRRLARGHLRRALVLRGRLQRGVGALGLPPRTASPSCSRRPGRCSCCSSLLLLGRGGSRATMILAAAAFVPIVILIIVALFDRELFEVRYFLVAVPLLFLVIARLVTGWIRRPGARARRCGGRGPHVAARVVGPADERRQPAHVRLPGRARGDQGGRRAAQPARVRAPRHEVRAGVLRARHSASRPLSKGAPPRRDGSPVFVLASFQDNKQFFDRTNKVVGQMEFNRRLLRKFHTAQTEVWEFR